MFNQHIFWVILESAEELEDFVIKAREIFVAEIGVDFDGFFRRDFIIRRELRAGRADVVHQATAH